jgi:hypothetical protein
LPGPANLITIAAFNATESELHMASIFPNKSEAIIALEIAIFNYLDDPGPGRWVVDSGRSFIALTWICVLDKIPLGFDNEIPWKSFGGDEILRNARLLPEQFVAKVSGPGGYFASAIISVRD